MARTSYTGYLRQFGGADKRSATPAVLPAVLQFTVDVALTNNPTGVFLPSGAIPLFVQNISANGSAASTTDIGAEGALTNFGSAVPNDVYGGLVSSGAALGTELTARTEIYTNAQTAGTGNVTFAIYYVMQDDQSA